MRNITVNVLPESRVPGGHSIGIKLYSEGVTVVGYYFFESGGKSFSPAREAGIKIGDTILAINGQPVKDVNRAAQILERAGAKRIILSINREGEEMELSLEPAYSAADEGYRIGLYIRDSAAGVGTLSFYNPRTGSYGALGHIVLDADTNKPVNLSNGTIVKARIIDVKTARRGQPGEKTGIFMEHDNFSGNIEKNTSCGIFGRPSFHIPIPYQTPFPGPGCTGRARPAEILTVIEDDTIKSFM